MEDVVRRHLLDAGGDAPHRLDLWLRGLPASNPLTVVPFSIRFPSLSAVACVAPFLLVSRSLPGPPFVRDS